MSSEVLIILHLVFICFFLGGQLSYIFIVQPASHRFFSLNDQIYFLQNVLKRQNPILLLALCLAVITGGLMITPIKGSLGASYFSVFGAKLIVKLAYFFLVFFITAYQTLAVGFKIRFLDPATPGLELQKKLNSVRVNMTVTVILNVVITAYVIYLGRGL